MQRGALRLKKCSVQMNYMKLGKASGPLGLLQKLAGDKCLKSLTNISNILFKDKLLVQGMLRSLVPIFTEERESP